MRQLLLDSELRSKMGKAARERFEKDFELSSAVERNATLIESWLEPSR